MVDTRLALAAQIAGKAPKRRREGYVCSNTLTRLTLTPRDVGGPRRVPTSFAAAFAAR